MESSCVNNARGSEPEVEALGFSRRPRETTTRIKKETTQSITFTQMIIRFIR